MRATSTGARGSDCGPPPVSAATPATRGYASGKDDYLHRLRKIEGQVRGLQKMIEEGRWCPDVVTQVAAAIRALQEISVGVLNDHLRHCVLIAARTSAAEGELRLEEVAATIRQVVRL